MDCVFYYVFLYLAYFVVSTNVIFIWVLWILMAYAVSTTYLLTKLPQAVLYKYHGKQIKVSNMEWLNCG